MPKSILLVDDSELVHKMYPAMLRGLADDGPVIRHAGNGHECLERLAEHPDISLIMLDINMPVMSGIETLRRLKSIEAFAEIPVLVISTRGSERDLELCVEAGAQGYLVKPFSPSVLRSRVREILYAGTDRISGGRQFVG